MDDTEVIDEFSISSLKKPQKLICANLWVIYWKHELHESNEFDFCGFLFA